MGVKVDSLPTAEEKMIGFQGILYTLAASAMLASYYLLGLYPG